MNVRDAGAGTSHAGEVAAAAAAVVGAVQGHADRAADVGRAGGETILVVYGQESVELTIKPRHGGLAAGSERIRADLIRAVAETAAASFASVSALGPAMSAFKGSTSPQLARAIQATENVWKAIEAEFGLLGSVEVAKLVGSPKSGRSFAADQRAAGKIVGIKRGNRVLYPGFQFDLKTGRTLPGIPALLALSKEVGWDEEDLILWLVAPSGYFHGDRPVDHLNDSDLVEKARQKATVEW